jgi:hypothetical protein
MRSHPRSLLLRLMRGPSPTPQDDDEKQTTAKALVLKGQSRGLAKIVPRPVHALRDELWQVEKQIPCGNDNKKNKGKNNCTGSNRRAGE